MGHGNSFQRKLFCYAGSATHPSSQFRLCLSASPSLWHYRANATYDADFAFPPWSSLLRWVLNPCVDLVLRSAVPAMAFTTASFTCWLRHQVHIRGSFAIPFVSSPRQRRDGVWVTWLGLRTSRTCSHLFQFDPRTGRVCSRLFRVGNRQNRFGALCFVYCFALIRIKALSGGKLVNVRFND
jgi:hypothetical protein